MDQRRYNIYFHTHTISGIITAALLYIIFFAGSLSFFKKDITSWQRGESTANIPSIPDYNHLLDSLALRYNMMGRDLDFYPLNGGDGTHVYMSASKDTSTVLKKDGTPLDKKEQGRAAILYHFANLENPAQQHQYDMGEFLYRLHFLAPLNEVPIRIGTPFGYLLAGITAFIYLFALITGLFLHWNKIKQNFFLFRPRANWKTIWTDLHTVLGVIGLPFHFIFSITGIILITNFLLTTPFSHLLYNDDQAKMFEELQSTKTITVSYQHQPLEADFDMNTFIASTLDRWEGGKVSRIYIRNFGDQSMEVALEAKALPSVNFAGTGYIRQKVASGQILDFKSPTTDTTYIDTIRSLIYHLHFGDFGGRPIQIAFFLMGIMGCAIILSGIMIWLVARDKNIVSPHKRKFNFWTTNIFLSICLSMLPVTAFTLVCVKLAPSIDKTFIYQCFFLSWAALTSYFLLLQNLNMINRHTWILSTFTCLAVPFTNGLHSGLWISRTWEMRQYDILFIDVLFLALAVISAFAYFAISLKKGDTFEKK